MDYSSTVSLYLHYDVKESSPALSEWAVFCIKAVRNVPHHIFKISFFTLPTVLVIMWNLNDFQTLPFLNF